MTGNSATSLATQQSIKKYVDDQDELQDEFRFLLDTNINTGVTLAGGHITVYDGTSKWFNRAVTGDIAMSSTGVSSIASGAVVNADVNASAGIAYSKLNLTGAILNADITDLTVANAKLANSTVTVTGNSGSTAIDLGDTLTIQGTANEVVTAMNGDVLTIGMPDDVTITGDLIVNGDMTTHATTEVSIGDVNIKLAKDNAGDSADFGFYGKYVSSGTKYSGLFRDQSNTTQSTPWTFVNAMTAEPGATATFTTAMLATIRCGAIVDATVDGGTF
jgi:formylmethanofuran dehydrogenase subunit C